MQFKGGVQAKCKLLSGSVTPKKYTWYSKACRIKQTAEVIHLDGFTNHVNCWWNVWKTVISVSRPCWQKCHGSHLEICRRPQGFRFQEECDLPACSWLSHDLCRGLSEWLICPSVEVWADQYFTNIHHSVLSETGPMWGTKHEKTNDTVRCSLQVGITWKQISRCLKLWRAQRSRAQDSLSKEIRAAAKWSTWTYAALRKTHLHILGKAT